MYNEFGIKPPAAIYEHLGTARGQYKTYSAANSTGHPAIAGTTCVVAGLRHLLITHLR